MKDVEFTPTALRQLHYWQTTDPRVYDRIDLLLKDIQDRPFTGIGKPEPLKHELKGFWSRRITKEHRLVYKVTATSIVVIACRYHY